MQSSANKKINLALLYGTTSHSCQIEEKEVFRSQYIANGLSEYTAHNYAVHTGKMIAGCKRRETYRLSACNDPSGIRGPKMTLAPTRPMLEPKPPPVSTHMNL